MSVKICGVKTLEAAKKAAENGADFVGIIMVPNRQRSIDPDAAKQISAYLRGLPEPRPKLVGVFRNQELDHVIAMQKEIPLDFVQLHGSEPLSWVDQIPTSVIKRVVPSSPDFVEQVLALKKFQKSVFALIDSEMGGDGKVFDWSPLGDIAESGGQYILAGGLNPENVASALQQPGCIGVDVSGGVETDGAKDMQKIQLFLQNARQ